VTLWLILAIIVGYLLVVMLLGTLCGLNDTTPTPTPTGIVDDALDRYTPWP
jgi:hypothetical protein